MMVKTKNKTWTLTVNNQPLDLTLAPPSLRGICQKCKLDKEISIISERGYEQRKFCWGCSLDNLYELEIGDYEIEHKTELLKEIRLTLHENPNSEESKEQLLECYG